MVYNCTPLILFINLEKDNSQSDEDERERELLSVDEKLRPDLIRENSEFDHYRSFVSTIYEILNHIFSSFFPVT
jgi:hypothetical protein